MTRHSPEYTAYLRSDAWSQVRQLVVDELDHHCEDCGQKAYPLEVHHLTYDRLGCERRSDLKGLCATCHREADRARSRDTWLRQEERRVEGWARKCGYSDEYIEANWESIEQRFEGWLASKGEL